MYVAIAIWSQFFNLMNNRILLYIVLLYILIGNFKFQELYGSYVMVVHTFNPITWEAEAGGSL